ncbi:MAG: acetate/propionate family kinase [Halioglobus sp.]
MKESGESTAILAVNGGSSSLKAQLFAGADGEPQPLCSIRVDDILGRARWRTGGRHTPDSSSALVALDGLEPGSRHAEAMRAILRWLEGSPDYPAPAAIGHRVVHGGDLFRDPARVDAQLIEALRGLTHLAPLHQGINVDLVEACADAAPDIPQVACFDTMFHQRQAPLERHYALPAALSAAGIQRYGFHGISYDYVSRRLRTLLPGKASDRAVIAHLGAGASLCAIRKGRSVATTMGFSTLDGVPMGSRCGHIDPGVLIYLMREQGLDADGLEDLLYRRSGLLGVSGISGDMKELRQSRDPRAATAIVQFCYRIVREIGSLAAALGGLDALVFTGGIGENDPALRGEVAAGCSWLGARLDDDANARGDRTISAPGSGLRLLVIPTSEETMIARYTKAVLGTAGA